MDRIQDEIRRYSEENELNDPATDDLIKEYQERNGVTLPLQFIELLKKFDGGELFVPGTQIYGISSDNNSKNLTEINKLHNIFSIPDSLLIIGKENFGDFICVDTNNGCVIQWDHENDTEFCCWNSIKEWLSEILSIKQMEA